MNTVKTAVTLLLCAVLLTGCQKDDNPDNTGNTIKLMFIGQITDTANATPLPEAAAGVRASVASINAQGGLYGKSLELIVCDDKADANEATKCARKAAREGVVATVGNTSNFGNVILPVLEQAGIASIGNNPISSQDFASSVAFPLQAGSPGMVAGAARLLAAQGARRIRIASVDSPAGAVGKQFAEVGLKGTESRIAGLTLVPIGAPDYAIYANTVLQDSDGILISMNADQAARFITALHQTGTKIPIATILPALPPATVKQIGDAAEGLLVAAPFRPITAGGEANIRFMMDMKIYSPNAKTNGFSQQTWLAVQTFYRAMVAIPPDEVLTASHVIATIRNLDGLVLGGMVPPYSTKTERQPPFNRLFNNQILYGKVQNGEVVLIDEQWQSINLGD